MAGQPISLALRRLVAVGGFVILLVGAATYAALTDDDPVGDPVAQGDQDGPVSLTTPPEGLPQTGPGLSEPGILLVATPLPDATVEVSEWVIASRASASIDLDPLDLSAATGVFAGRTLTASEVTVRVDGEEVLSDRSTVDGPVSVELPRAERVYEVSYVLENATAISEPSSSGRALAVLSPLSTADAGGEPVVIATSGDSVRNLSCPTSQSPQDPCAQGSSPYLRTNIDLSGDTAVVVAQLDLPGA